MRTRILLASAALLLASAAARHADDNVRGDMFVAQGMTGSAGSNSARTAVSPRIDPGPDPSRDTDAGAPRTSRDNGTSSPLAGDEANRARPGTGVHRDGGAPAGGAPSSRGESR